MSHYFLFKLIFFFVSLFKFLNIDPILRNDECAKYYLKWNFKRGIILQYSCVYCNMIPFGKLHFIKQITCLYKFLCKLLFCKCGYSTMNLHCWKTLYISSFLPGYLANQTFLLYIYLLFYYLQNRLCEFKNL